MKRIVLVTIAILFAGIIALTAVIVFLNKNEIIKNSDLPAINTNVTSGNGFMGLLKIARNEDAAKLGGEEQDQINFLFLGVGGEEHISGNYLTDTIVLTTLVPSTGKIAVISIPRDLLVRSPDEKYFTRVNALYSYPARNSLTPNGERASLSPDPQGKIYKKFPGPMGVDYTKK